ncbi:MAG TPA: lysophospholipid acyltransferase family protein [Tepidisphaeraceae bacterium]|nr:lysophospholipid acyltransferase family protein [Tepidisphaeraceae bacterium]
MKNWFYFLVYAVCYPPMLVTSSPVVLHRERSRRKGPYILAVTHFSPYDVACIIKETPRVLDFVSVTELFRHPLPRWFLSNMGAFPLDRGRPDSGTVRVILDRLERGRPVALFPEGHIRTEKTSVLNGGRMKTGVARIARMANVPIVPCVVLGARGYHRPRNWIPLRLTRYGINYGEPIFLTDDAQAEPEVFEERLRRAFMELNDELRLAMGKGEPRTDPAPPSIATKAD